MPKKKEPSIHSPESSDSPEPIILEEADAAFDLNQALEEEVKNIRNQADENPLSSNQIDILKRYIELKEAEVRDLKHQQQQYQEHTEKSAIKIDGFIKHNRLLTAQLEEAQRNTARIQAEMEEERREHQEQITLLRSDFEEKLKQAGATQDQVKDLLRKREEFKEKVREDLKRIKLKERELENKYELLKNDTQTLLDAKDKQILDLRKKADALDLELENFDERLRENLAVLNEVSIKKRRLIDTLKIAITLLEDIDKETLSAVPDSNRKAG